MPRREFTHNDRQLAVEGIFTIDAFRIAVAEGLMTVSTTDVVIPNSAVASTQAMDAAMDDVVAGVSSGRIAIRRLKPSDEHTVLPKVSRHPLQLAELGPKGHYRLPDAVEVTGTGVPSAEAPFCIQLVLKTGHKINIPVKRRAIGQLRRALKNLTTPS